MGWDQSAGTFEVVATTHMPPLEALLAGGVAVRQGEQRRGRQLQQGGKQQHAAPPGHPPPPAAASTAARERAGCTSAGADTPRSPNLADSDSERSESDSGEPGAGCESGSGGGGAAVCGVRVVAPGPLREARLLDLLSAKLGAIAGGIDAACTVLRVDGVAVEGRGGAETGRGGAFGDV